MKARRSSSSSNGAKDAGVKATSNGATHKDVPMPTSLPMEGNFGTGCLSCGEDDDHANLLLCEGCNAEYHTYCLSPPLRSVPASDWFCTKCIAPRFENDDLHNLVNALPPSFTSRYGEVCWAHGGAGFGWWPSFIYDPRLTVGSARQLARKNLGKRHLVYFFECHDAPFDCLTDSKVVKWDEGLLDDYHLGKTAKSSGKGRFQLFQQALQAATLEAGKPIECRMEFNHSDQPQVLPSNTLIVPKPTQQALANSPKKRAREEKDLQEASKPARREVRGFQLQNSEAKEHQVAARRNLRRSIEALRTSNIREHDEDDFFCCKLLSKSKTDGENATNIGFIRLPSRKTSSFADARNKIQEELADECSWLRRDWRFFIPALGPVTKKQETTLGPIFPLLNSSAHSKDASRADLHSRIQVLLLV